MSTKPTNPKDAVGSTKPPMSVVPFGFLLEMGVGMLEGACKYSRHNYRDAGVRISIYVDAAMRHIMRFWEGQDIDPDSGINHLTKAACCLAVIRDAQMNSKCFDDRPPKMPEGWYEEIERRTKELLSRYPNPLPPTTEVTMEWETSNEG